MVKNLKQKCDDLFVDRFFGAKKENLLILKSDFLQIIIFYGIISELKDIYDSSNDLLDDVIADVRQGYQVLFDIVSLSRPCSAKTGDRSNRGHPQRLIIHTDKKLVLAF